MTSRPSIAIIGGGMAAARLASKLRDHGNADQLNVICDEAYFGYNRVLLPGYLGESNSKSDLLFEHGHQPHLSVITENPATHIDCDKRVIKLREGHLDYDVLVLATGSVVPRPACLPQDLSNVFTLRSMADAATIRELSRQASKAVVIGGGLLGLETASAIARHSVKVSIIHRNANILNRQLNAGASQALRRQLEARGLSFRLQRELVEVQTTDNAVTRVVLSDEAIETDLLVLATGTTPNVSLARQAGIACHRGVVIDDQLRTSHDHVYAIGECAEFRDSTCGLVAPVYEQADILAENLSGGCRRYAPTQAPVRLKVDGVALYSAGDVNAAGDETIISSSATTLYRRLTFRDNQLISAILLGDTRGSADIQQYMNHPVTSSGTREQLLFGSLGE